VKLVTGTVPLKKFYIEQMFFQSACNFTTMWTQPVKRFERAMQYIYDIKFGTLQVRNNDISLRKCSGDSEDLRISEGTLVTRGVCPIW